ncbi:TIGR01244 family phosphatase [Sphingomonas sp. ABOLD]|jgi:sulfide:quinone oxidoreductase|uniref:TIGR01244 family sulfur transferase n=1 Tax=unclassified Sphingomonas TaxID=196159 RepID=UPI000F7E33E8|nr:MULTISPECIES: TIGR01244 family sulfur transferase [unclassified Sphingomonas]MCU6455972.1 TIGR01244 family phosphatase [Sphingomonas sp. A2-49]RSV45570.1 TIGR01244 family phosphatase [Sphingomonas sp. ABOLD]
MPFNELDAKLSASPQLTPNDVAAAAMQGYRTIIDLRPDGEEPGQPSAATIEAVAREHGLAFVHIPVVPGEVSEAQVRIMNRALDEKPTPALGYCRTGSRVATLWALALAGEADTDTLINTARDAGYDIEKLRPRLQPA